MILYRVANWEDFETCETKKLVYLKWVPTPNKHDGLGYRRMVMQKNRSDLFAAWNLILQVASKGKRDSERGKLIRSGRPLGAEDLALMTGFPAQIFDSALKFFSSPEVGWLVVDGQQSPECSVEPPAISGDSPAEGKEGRKEGKVGANESPQRQTDEEWVQSLVMDLAYQGIDVPREYRKMLAWCQVNKKPPTRRRFVNWLNRAEQPMRNGQPPRKGPNI